MKNHADLPFLRKGEAATYLRCTLRSLTDLVRQGRIPCHRVGAHHVLFKRDDLDAFLESVRDLKGGPDHD